MGKPIPKRGSAPQAIAPVGKPPAAPKAPTGPQTAPARPQAVPPAPAQRKPPAPPLGANNEQRERLRGIVSRTAELIGTEEIVTPVYIVPVADDLPKFAYLLAWDAEQAFAALGKQERFLGRYKYTPAENGGTALFSIPGPYSPERGAELFAELLADPETNFAFIDETNWVRLEPEEHETWVRHGGPIVPAAPVEEAPEPAAPIVQAAPAKPVPAKGKLVKPTTAAQAEAQDSEAVTQVPPVPKAVIKPVPVATEKSATTQGVFTFSARFVGPIPADKAEGAALAAALQAAAEKLGLACKTVRFEATGESVDFVKRERCKTVVLLTADEVYADYASHGLE